MKAIDRLLKELDKLESGIYCADPNQEDVVVVGLMKQVKKVIKIAKAIKNEGRPI